MTQVMLVINALLRHGPGMMVYSTAQGLAARGFQVTVVSLDPPDAALKADLEALGVRVEALAGETNAFRGLGRLVGVNRPDILHTHGLRADLIGRLVGRGRRVPAIWTTIHDAPDMYRMALGSARGRLALSAQVASLPLVDVAVTVADTIGRAYRAIWPLGHMAHRFRTIYNGVPDHWHDGARPQDLVIGALARLVPRKGIDYLIDAARMLAPRYPDVRWEVAGEGEQREALERRIAEAGLGERFRLLGAQRDVARLLSGWSIFALPSLNECLPLSLLEAMSAGKPVVASDVGGVGEAVVPGESGILVPPAHPEELVRALGTLIGDEELRRQYGAAARRRYLERFRVDTMVAQYASLAERASERRSVRPLRPMGG